MTPERWQQVKGVLENVLEIAQPERAAFLDQACDGDQALRQEVESLLDSGEQGRSSFLRSPPSLRLVKGTRLGDYEIQSLLGAGGMGEVYRARDLRLRRGVAIKVLPAFVASDPERLRRFEQEATAAAALNHPNILAVHQMGTFDGAPYLVSELLEGETLRELIKRGPMTVRRTMDYGIQIARGLAAAHEKGIVHRDLKPENLFVTKDGRVKILDFGLAKLVQPQAGAGHSAVTLGDETEPGMVMGTAGYMSPEQVRGQAADHRADIFAFGAIVYEMLTGKRAFQKPTSPETLTAILNEDPPGISQVVPNLPPALQRVVHRCLEKNPEQRFQSASDLAFALDALSDSGESAHSATAARAATGARTLWKVTIPAAVVLVALAVGSWLHFNSRLKLTDNDTIVLADFANSTGDPVFDDTLKTALNVSLRQSPFLNVLSDSEVTKTLQQMTRPASTKLTPEVARELCQRAGSKAYLAGAIGSLGSEYVLGLKAVNCQNGDTLAQEQLTAAAKERVLDALGEAASKFRGELGESLGTVQKFDVPLAQATTSSLEALKAYSMARKLRGQKSEIEPIPFLMRAIELDPNFAVAYEWLAVAYDNVDNLSQSAKFATKAFELRDRVSEREKLEISGFYYDRVLDDLDLAEQTYQHLTESYPRDSTAWHELGTIHLFRGRYERSRTEYLEGARVDPGAINTFYHAGLASLAMARFDDAKANFEQASARNYRDTGLLHGLYQLAFLTGDQAARLRLLEETMGKPVEEEMFLSLEADSQAYFGRQSMARQLSRRAREASLQRNTKDPAAYWAMSAALREGELGSRESARQQAEDALSWSQAREVRIGAAIALARAGHIDRAQRLSEELANQRPSDTLLRRVWLPVVRAAIALQQSKPARAIELLEGAGPDELGSYELLYQGPLYPAYLRGEAYLMLHDGPAAVAEFQKFPDHRGVVMNFPTGALARLGLARAYLMSGDTAKARAAYQDFLTLWKDADPDIPILKQAKAEYAKLQ
jgi:eukaryotic-like serine/threonine-protein kinase